MKIMVLIILIYIINIIAIYFYYKNTVDNLIEENNTLTKRLSDETFKRTLLLNRSKYSKDILDYFRLFIGQIAVLKFRKFNDTHDLSKVTSERIKTLINDITIEIRKSVVFENIDFNNTLFTEDFLNTFLIEVTINDVKELLDNKINESAEEIYSF